MKLSFRIFAILLLIPLLSSAQRFTKFEKEVFFFASTEFDPRNAAVGSRVNGPAFDGVFNVGYRNYGFQAQASYEHFRNIGFYSFGFQAGHVFNRKSNWNYALLGGIGWIQRNVNWLKYDLHGSASISGQLEYHYDNFFFLMRSEGRLRGDLDKFIASGYAGIGYKI